MKLRRATFSDNIWMIKAFVIVKCTFRNLKKKLLLLSNGKITLRLTDEELRTSSTAWMKSTIHLTKYNYSTKKLLSIHKKINKNLGKWNRVWRFRLCQPFKSSQSEICKTAAQLKRTFVFVTNLSVKIGFYLIMPWSLSFCMCDFHKIEHTLY